MCPWRFRDAILDEAGADAGIRTWLARLVVLPGMPQSRLLPKQSEQCQNNREGQQADEDIFCEFAPALDSAGIIILSRFHTPSKKPADIPVGAYQMWFAKPCDVICNGPVLLLPITRVPLADIRIGKKVPDVMFNVETGKTCFQRNQNFRTFRVPVPGLLKRIKRQRHQPLQLAGQKFRCHLVG